MQNILIIGAGDFQLPLVQRASLSYNVLLAAPVISDAFKPYITDSLLIDVRDEEAILAYAREHSICGVITLLWWSTSCTRWVWAHSRWAREI